MPKDVRRIKTERDIQTAFLDLLKTKKFRSSRRQLINSIADLSHHRTYGSVYGGSII